GQDSIPGAIASLRGMPSRGRRPTGPGMVPGLIPSESRDRQVDAARRAWHEGAGRKASDEGRHMDVPVYNMQGEQVGTMPIDEASLGGEVNPALIKQAVVMYHANLRQGSSKTKTRSEVEGSGKKIYKQKGTGRARHGDKYAPQFRGGGHAKAKNARREHFRQDMPKKMRRKANRNA